VTIEFTPEEKGGIPFQCQMGMLRGKVIVEG
jgi:plastocyanin domain-containing protein